MNWNLEEALAYYHKQGAPRDQTALTGLLKEVQQENSGSIPMAAVVVIAEYYGIKESFLLAIIKRLPSLKLSNQHCLELCSGPNCGKHTALADCAEKLHIASGKKFSLKFVPCMRMCGKGPNVKWDSKLYHKADGDLLQKLLKDAGIDFDLQS